jgi:peptidylprolyl isomerase
VLPVLVLTLAACGGNSSSSSTATSSSPLDAVTITGAVGQKPQIEWKSALTATKVQSTTITKGTGDTINSGDQVSAQIWIGNGTSKQQAYSTYDQGGR